MAKDTRTRNWNIIVYPDSPRDVDWRSYLDDQHIEWIESPLHDQDLNPTGELKKAHWHVLLMFGGVKSYDQVLEFIKPLNCPIPQKCHNAKASVRYMAHLDNPDKIQYSVNDIVCHGGVDVADLLKPSTSERYTIIAEMMDWCDQNSCFYLSTLINYARVDKFDSWFPILCDSGAYIMNSYLKASRQSYTDFKKECGD